nr:hypothetical protein [Solirubrobacterales bacterium]
MPVNEASELIALTLISAVHIVGGVALIWGMLGADSPGWGPRWWRRGDDPGDDPPGDDPSPLSPAPPGT